MTKKNVLIASFFVGINALSDDGSIILRIVEPQGTKLTKASHLFINVNIEIDSVDQGNVFSEPTIWSLCYAASNVQFGDRRAVQLPLCVPLSAGEIPPLKLPDGSGTLGVSERWKIHAWLQQGIVGLGFKLALASVEWDLLLEEDKPSIPGGSGPSSDNLHPEATVVNILEDRGSNIFMHWFTFVVSGLLDISHLLPKPILFHTTITESFQRESLELLKPDYEHVENVTGYDPLVRRYGAPLIGQCHVADPYYHFVRYQILVKNNLEVVSAPTRRIYISRSKSHLLSTTNKGYKRRQIINEVALVDTLKGHGFECIHLEDYSLRDKIGLFQEAKIVISPNGGAFTMCLFANHASTMVFIRDEGTTETQYSHACEVLSIPTVFYEKVRCLDVDGNETKGAFGKDFSIELLDQEDFVRTIQPYL